MRSISAGYPMQTVATDLVGPLPESDSGNWYILMVADYFTRWAEAFPLQLTLWQPSWSMKIFDTGATSLGSRATI